MQRYKESSRFVTAVCVYGLVSFALPNLFASERQAETRFAQRRAGDSLVTTREVALDNDLDGFGVEAFSTFVEGKRNHHYIIDGQTYIDVAMAKGLFDCDDANPLVYRLIIGGTDVDTDQSIVQSQPGLACVGDLLLVDGYKPYYRSASGNFDWFGPNFDWTDLRPWTFNDCHDRDSMVYQFVWGGLDRDRDGFITGAASMGCVGQGVRSNGRTYHGMSIRLDPFTSEFGYWWLALPKLSMH